MSERLKIGVHKFASCDGCQLAFLNRISDVLALSDRIEIVHFIEAGFYAPDKKVDVSFVEGSVTTPDDKLRIEQVRKNSDYLITMGACATSGGIQALRNTQNADSWMKGVYPNPQFIQYLDKSLPIKEFVDVDYEIWGCPVTSEQILATAHSLALGVVPTRYSGEKLCQACKREQNVCVLVTRNQACLGPVTHTGCGALCPAFGRACYGCFGPDAKSNFKALIQKFGADGRRQDQIDKAFRFLYSYDATEQLGQDNHE